MASGSHICKGNMALLPAAPMKIKAVAQLRTAPPKKVLPAAEAKIGLSGSHNWPKSNVLVK